MRIDRKFKALASFALVVLLGGLGSLGVAHAQSGSAGVQSGKGFGCMPGFEWKMFPDGVARCTSTAAPRAIAATSCAAAPSYTTDKTGSCTFSLPATGGGATASVRNTNTDSFTGALTIECSAGGQWTNPIGSCVEVPRITSFNRSASSVLIGDGMTVSWTSSGATAANLVCSGANNSSAANLGANSNRGLSTANEGSTTCTLTVTGPGGTSAPASLTWSARGPLDCSATSISPGVCRYPIPALSSGQSQVASTNTAGYGGSVTATCNDGTWSYSGATCEAQSACTGGVKNYGKCRFSVPWIAHGGTSDLENYRAGYSGAITASCDNGSLSYSGGWCEADAPPPPPPPPPPTTPPPTSTPVVSGCDAAFLARSGERGLCYFNVPALSHGSSSAVSAESWGAAGQITATCANGTLSYSSLTCGASSPPPEAPKANCAATDTTYGSCSFSVPAIAHGNSSSVTDSTAGYTGQVNASCNNGALSYSNQSCSEDPCAKGSHTYGSCGFTIPALSAGSSETVADSTVGFTGSVTATCSKGTLSFSARSCVEDVKVPVASLSLSPSQVREDVSFTATWSGTNSPTYYEVIGVNMGLTTSWSGTPMSLGLVPGPHTISVQACNTAGCSDVVNKKLEVLPTNPPPPPPPPPVNTKGGTMAGQTGYSTWSSYMNNDAGPMPCLFSGACPKSACDAGPQAVLNDAYFESWRDPWFWTYDGWQTSSVDMGAVYERIYTWQCGDKTSPVYQYRVAICGGYIAYGQEWGNSFYHACRRWGL